MWQLFGFEAVFSRILSVDTSHRDETAYLSKLLDTRFWCIFAIHIRIIRVRRSNHVVDLTLHIRTEARSCVRTEASTDTPNIGSSKYNSEPIVCFNEPVWLNTGT